MGIRLGYACINLSLQQAKEGPRLKAVTAKRLGAMDSQERRANLYQVGRNNLKTLEAVLKWNDKHGVKLFRVTSELVPLATHPVAAEWDWEADLSYEFEDCARLAAATGVRLTSHPGHYTVLNARDPEVVERGIADLVYHNRVLELLGADAHPDWGMVIHVGGSYGDKAAAAVRFAEAFQRLPSAVSNRLWIENDDKTWDTEEAFAVAQSVERPMVLDIHHHRMLRTDDWLPWLTEILKTWGQVRPKVHFSTPRDDAHPRNHADGIDAADFALFMERTEELDLDVMLECKAKDIALRELVKDLCLAP